MSPRPLRISFLESGIGETILIEFPDGSVGIVDAHPSGTNSRDDILTIIAGRTVEFACLTHPHLDHGKDLVQIIRTQRVKEFWHSLSPVNLFVYQLTQSRQFLSHLQDLADKLEMNWAEFMIDLLDAVRDRELKVLSLNESHKQVQISGVNIHILAPEQSFVSKEEKRLQSALAGSSFAPFDPNDFSLVLAIEYGNCVVVLGGDAKKKSWRGALESWRRSRLPKATGLKLPHHGARNAFDLRPSNSKQKPVNCWNLCTPEVKAVIFAGTMEHPDPDVKRALEARGVQLYSLFNLDDRPENPNPLGIRLRGARMAKMPRKVRYSQVVFEISAEGNLSVATVP